MPISLHTLQVQVVGRVLREGHVLVVESLTPTRNNEAAPMYTLELSGTLGELCVLLLYIDGARMLFPVDGQVLNQSR